MNNNTAPSAKNSAWNDLDLNGYTPAQVIKAWKANSTPELIDALGENAVNYAEALMRQMFNSPGFRWKKRQAICDALGYHDVEYLGIMRRGGEHVYYLNAGDPYSATILFIGGALKIGSWGDLVESNKVMTPE